MKRSAVMITLVTSAALLAAAYIVVTGLTKSKDDTGAADDPSLILASYDSGTLTELSYTKKGSDMIKLEYSDSTGKWYVAGDHKYPLDSTYPGNMAAAISSVTATRLVEEPAEHLSDYGLDAPQYVINAAYGDKSRTYKIGDKNDFNSGYYFISSESDAIYMVPGSLAGNFDYSLLDMAVKDTIPALMSANITVKSILADASPLDDETVKSLTEFISGLKLGALTAYASDDTVLKTYGFKTNPLNLTVNYSEASTVTNTDNSISSTVHVDKSFKLSIGTAADKNVYCMVGASGLIYSIPSDLAFKISDAAG